MLLKNFNVTTKRKISSFNKVIKVDTDKLKAIDEDKSTELYAQLTVSTNRFLEKNSIHLSYKEYQY